MPDIVSLSFGTNNVIELTAIGSLIITIIGGFWRVINWLRDKFNEIEDHLESLLAIHEDKDQSRHEDNIQRFAVIETQLNLLIKNGKH